MEKVQFQPAEGITGFRNPLGSRFVTFYALRDDKGTVLFDTALPGVVTAWIDEGQLETPIQSAIISHADADHLGDTAALWERFSALQVIGRPADRAWIENHDALVRDRYDHARAKQGYGYTPETLMALRKLCGENFKVNGNSMI